jgi:hypothetical protein
MADALAAVGHPSCWPQEWQDILCSKDGSRTGSHPSPGQREL